MKRLALALFMSVLATAASARPDTRTVTCQQLQQLLERNGATVFTTGPTTYERLVSFKGNSCKVGQLKQRLTVQTRDKKCPVFRCSQFDLSPT